MNADYEQFWNDFHGVRPLLDRGHVAAVRERLVALRAHPQKKEFDQHGQVDFTYAVVLQMSARNRDDVATSVALLEQLLGSVNCGNRELNPFQLRLELASGLLLLGDHKKAEEVALVAVAESGDHPHAALAFQNLGCAQNELGRPDEASATYLKMIDVALATRNVGHAGIAAERLARIALARKKLDEAATWHDIALDVYKTVTPRHLPSLQDVALAVGAAPRLLIGGLPPQAAAIRTIVPTRSEIGDLSGAHLDLLSIDLGALHWLADRNLEAGCGVGVPLFVPDAAVRNRFSRLIVDEANSILPHDWALDIIMGLVRDLWPGKSDRIREWLRAKDPGTWTLQPQGDMHLLVWKAREAAPVLFGPELVGLCALLQTAFVSRAKSLSQTSGAVDFINLSDRHWPRPLQTYMVLQGQAAASGHGSTATLAELALRGRLARREENEADFMAIHFTPTEARALAQGGLVALHMNDVAVPGGQPIGDIGTTPLNEVNAANLPNPDYQKGDVERPGFVVDREYNTWFFAPSPSTPDKALYGANSQFFRDHFSPLHDKLDIVGSLRVKHYSAPIVDVHTPEDLARIRAELDAAVERLKPTNHVPPEAKMWFRGQTRGYLLERPEIACRHLFGLPYVDEPSLPGAAPRRGWNYLKVHSFLSVMLQGFLYRKAAQRDEDPGTMRDKWHAFCAEPGAWDLAVMLLAQHYGVPTHGIDITHNLDVALWFASNRYSWSAADGTATYTKLAPDAWSKEPREWPLIYAILPVTWSLKGAIREVHDLAPLGIHAPRPLKQSAAFFMGAHGLHRNRLAEALVCVMRLGPHAWPTQSIYADLFPSEAEDEPYAWMLDLKTRFTEGDIGQFLAMVPRYR